jgi:hypothetical protein
MRQLLAVHQINRVEMHLVYREAICVAIIASTVWLFIKGR